MMRMRVKKRSRGSGCVEVILEVDVLVSNDCTRYLGYLHVTSNITS
jgi:hypothetical protein